MLRTNELMPDGRHAKPEKSEPFEIHYQTVRADEIVRHFVKGYPVVEDYEWFFDATKGVFILKLFTCPLPASQKTFFESGASQKGGQ